MPSDRRSWAATSAGRPFKMLDDLDLKATVFTLDAEVLSNADLICTIAERGNEIAAHGFAHEDYVGAEGEKEFLERTYHILEDINGIAPVGWRALGKGLPIISFATCADAVRAIDEDLLFCRDRAMVTSQSTA